MFVFPRLALLRLLATTSTTVYIYTVYLTHLFFKKDGNKQTYTNKNTTFSKITESYKIFRIKPNTARVAAVLSVLLYG